MDNGTWPHAHVTVSIRRAESMTTLSSSQSRRPIKIKVPKRKERKNENITHCNDILFFLILLPFGSLERDMPFQSLRVAFTQLLRLSGLLRAPPFSSLPIISTRESVVQQKKIVMPDTSSIDTRWPLQHYRARERLHRAALA